MIQNYFHLELQKFVGSIFFGFDAELYDEAMDERAKANTSDLNEELGQVRKKSQLLSDCPHP